MNRKQATQVTLKNGEKIIVSLERGVQARRAMEHGNGIFTIPEDNNRTISVPMIGDVNDVWIEDVQVQLGEQIQKERKLLEDKAKQVPATATSPGYIFFLASSVKLRRKFGGSTNAIKNKLTDEQLPLVEEQMKKLGVTW